MSFLLGQLKEVIIAYGETECKTLRGDALAWQDIQAELTERDGGLEIALTASETPVRFLALRWALPLPEDALFLGDAWERSYGELQWRSMAPARLMPWYFLMLSQSILTGFGVKVRPSAFAQWKVDPKGVTLLLDLRNGRYGVRLDGRRLVVATVVTERYPLEKRSALSASHEFCRRLCDDPLLPAGPVVGANNWYYAYGDISRKSVLEDCRYLKNMTDGLPVTPFMVIDDGWQAKHSATYNGGPWDCGNRRFPDFPRLVNEMSSLGVKPGIWLRPLLDSSPALPQEWRMPIRDADGRICGQREALDPSRLEVLQKVQDDIRRMASWGFQLVKHDFTTYDIFGKWGFQMGNWPQDEAFSGFADQSRTAAEIVGALYRSIREAAGETLILGCNTIGHLAAGRIHISRTGDDTSGYSFDRTRRMGVNTLAFRLCQHNAFFAVDADCVGILDDSHTIPWECNRQWSELLAASGTAFFTSVRPDALTTTELDKMRQFYRMATSPTSAEPLDWLHNNLPSRWLINGQEKTFDWFLDRLEKSDALS